MNHITVIATPTWRVSYTAAGVQGKITQTFDSVEDAKTAYAAAVNARDTTWVLLEQFQKLAECVR